MHGSACGKIVTATSEPTTQYLRKTMLRRTNATRTCRNYKRALAHATRRKNTYKKNRNRNERRLAKILPKHNSRQARPECATRRGELLQHLHIIASKANWAGARPSVASERTARSTSCVRQPTLRANFTEISGTRLARPGRRALHRPTRFRRCRQALETSSLASARPVI